MKRSCLTWIFTSLLSFSIQAQSNQYWGFVYSPNLMGISKAGKSTNTQWLGQQACIAYQWRSNERLSYRAGLGYSFSQREYHSTKPYAIDNQFVRYRHQDLILPFQLQYAFPLKTNQVYATAGLLMAINLDREVLEYWWLSNESEKETQELTTEQDYKHLDLQVSIGFGYEYQLDAGKKLVVQPSFRSNFLTVLAFFPQEYLGSRKDPGAPPLTHVFGIELGYFFR